MFLFDYDDSEKFGTPLNLGLSNLTKRSLRKSNQSLYGSLNNLKATLQNQKYNMAQVNGPSLTT